MKNINKKPLLIIAGIFGVIILIIIVVAVTRSCSGPGKNYEKVEKKMVEAARKYYRSHEDLIPAESESSEISASELAAAGEMKELSEYLVDTSCNGSVKVFNNGGVFLVVPDLVCAEYKTKHLSEKIIDDNLVDNQEIAAKEYTSGLYNNGTTLVFKGKKPNNYLLFGDIVWRIIDIDENGIIRAVKTDPEKRTVVWDNKFNVEIKKTYGINDYKNSYVLEFLNASYKGFKETSREHIAPHSACISSRKTNDINIDRNIDCAEKLENQYISLFSVSDFANASLDENCKSLVSGSCINYNYISSFLSETWTTTAYGENTYDVVYLGGGLASHMNARKKLQYHWVVAFNGYEKYVAGTGTKEDPYVLTVTSEKD